MPTRDVLSHQHQRFFQIAFRARARRFLAARCAVFSPPLSARRAAAAVAARAPFQVSPRAVRKRCAGRQVRLDTSRYRLGLAQDKALRRRATYLRRRHIFLIS